MTTAKITSPNGEIGTNGTNGNFVPQNLQHSPLTDIQIVKKNNAIANFAICAISI